MPQLRAACRNPTLQAVLVAALLVACGDVATGGGAADTEQCTMRRCGSGEGIVDWACRACP